MRVWHPIPPSKLDRKRLLGEHVEIHAIASIISDPSKGYQNHPEVNRWRRNKAALQKRHDAVVKEMKRRGYNHQSPLGIVKQVRNNVSFPPPWESVKLMREKLKSKQ